MVQSDNGRGMLPGWSSAHDAAMTASRSRLPRPFLGVLGALMGLTLMTAWGQALRAQSSEPPPLPDVAGQDLVDSMRSDVRIVVKDSHEIEEYRAGNNVYMVKVKPKNAPPYYLIDEDGSGNLQWRRGGPGLERTQVPHWAIMRW